MNRCHHGLGPDQSQWRAGRSHFPGSAQPGHTHQRGRGPATRGGLGGVGMQPAAGPGLILLRDLCLHGVAGARNCLQVSCVSQICST